ncbi:MAG: phosphate regulon sensor histidine kinase PhoR [Burkholderiaceae bacterium]
MNPLLLFWLPAALRLALVLAGVGLVWFFVGPRSALAAALAALALMLGLQLHYLYRLGRWLEDPARRLPDGWGAWTEIFARLYRLNRDNERSSNELAEWLARFRQAMHLLPDGVTIMDDVLFLEWCNPAAERHLGLSLERDRGMRVTNLVRHPDFIDYVILGRYEEPLTLSLRERKLIVQIIPFENRRQILVTHDATESERIERMRRDFVANASHELRTPLTVINGFLEIADAQPDLDPQVRQSHIRLMVEQGRRMQNLVNDMLTLTRLESIDHPLRPERIDIGALLREVLREGNALSAGRHALTLEMDAPDIAGSVDELRSAFGNLVSNAVRYTPDGGRIALHWRMSDAGPQFAVQDTGIGIRAEDMPRLTERFYRIDKSRSRETQGTGLGLAIVKHVLLRHHARLAIESEPGRGSTFTIQFPAAALAGDAPPKET